MTNGSDSGVHPPNPHDSPHDTYTSPLAARNASPEMLRLWSHRHKFNTWRRIWLAVAEAQQACGLDISDEQISELKAVVERGITDEELARASELERELRHDVMAHVHCLGEQCPKAKPIIHLGCTSQDVVCNADAAVITDALRHICGKLCRCIVSLATFAQDRKSIPTLGFTHYQSAQPVTVGRRAAMWSYDLSLCIERLRRETWVLKPRGMKGATGTQASFLTLFGSDSKTDKFEAEFMSRFARFTGRHAGSRPKLGDVLNHSITGQTYPRAEDAFLISDLASTAAVLHKIATDIRLLSNRKEIDEPFGSSQIGSSAMPYKRNPMRCERICGLTRFVMNLVGNAYDTAATQWLERTLDDSSNRRLSLPEAFLALDGALDLMHNVASGLIVNEAMVRRNLMAELPFLATENILMEAVKRGGDRQDLHERIRVHSMEAGRRVKQEGLDNDLIERLRNDPAFESVHHLLTEDQLLDPMKYIGRSVEQTERFVREVIEPLREQYADELKQLGDSEPRV
ncbi:MAG: adenylosuccinate lyase [Phycisphaerales bacterium JB037]